MIFLIILILIMIVGILAYLMFSTSDYEDFYNKKWEDKDDNLFK